MSAVVSGFGGAGAAALLAPAPSSDPASADGGGLTFGSALLSALAGDAEAATPSAGPADPAPSGDENTPATTTTTTPQTAPPAPTPAVFLGLTAPATPPAQADAAPTTPDEGPHGKPSGSARGADADQHHDTPSPAVADVLAAGQLAVQQALAAAPVPPASPAPAPPAESSAPVGAVSAPSSAAAPVLASAPLPARGAAAQPVESDSSAGSTLPPAPGPVSAPVRPTAKTPSEPSTPSADTDQSTIPATATPVPVQAPAAPTFASALASAAPTAPTAPSPAPPLQQQLAQPVMTLARQPDGDHVVVVRIAPDDLGPVTVHARVSDTSVHIELFAPSDAGRDAIRQILADLRRDLNASTANASVSVSDQNAPGAESGGGGRSPWTSGEERGTTAPADLPADLPEEPAPARSVVPDLPIPTGALPGARTLDIVV